MHAIQKESNVRFLPAVDSDTIVLHADNVTECQLTCDTFKRSKCDIFAFNNNTSNCYIYKTFPTSTVQTVDPDQALDVYIHEVSTFSSLLEVTGSSGCGCLAPPRQDWGNDGRGVVSAKGCLKDSFGSSYT
jgi:hypothetical protein